MDKTSLTQFLGFRDQNLAFMKIRRPKYLRKLRIISLPTDKYILRFRPKHIWRFDCVEVDSHVTSALPMKWARRRFGIIFRDLKIRNFVYEAQMKELAFGEFSRNFESVVFKQIRKVKKLKINLSTMANHFGQNLLPMKVFFRILQKIKVIKNLQLDMSFDIPGNMNIEKTLQPFEGLQNVEKIQIKLSSEALVELETFQKINLKNVKCLKLDGNTFFSFDLFSLNLFFQLRYLDVSIDNSFDEKALLNFIQTSLSKMFLTTFIFNFSLKHAKDKFFEYFIRFLSLPKSLHTLNLTLKYLNFNKYFDVSDKNDLTVFTDIWNQKTQGLGLLESVNLNLAFSESFKPVYTSCLTSFLKDVPNLKRLEIAVTDCFSSFAANQMLGQKRAFNLNDLLSSLKSASGIEQLDISVPFLYFALLRTNLSQEFLNLGRLKKISLFNKVDPSAYKNLDTLLKVLPHKLEELSLKFCDIVQDSEIPYRLLLLANFRHLRHLEITLQVRYISKKVFLTFFEEICQIPTLLSLRVHFPSLHLDHHTIESINNNFGFKLQKLQCVEIKIDKYCVIYKNL